MPKPMFVWSGSAWVSVASEVESLATYATQSYADNVPGTKMIIPTSVTVGSGSGSVSNLGAITFSGSSSVSVNGCFTSTYQNYLVMVNITNSTSNGGPVDLRFRGRNAGTDITSADYYFNYKATRQDGTSTDRTDNGATSTLIGRTGTGIPKQGYQITCFDPADNKQFAGFGFNMAANGSFENSIFGGKINTSGAMDSFSLISTTNVITGTIRVYGLKNG